MNKVNESDTIFIYVKENPLRRVAATVTHVSDSGVVYFRPLKIYTSSCTQILKTLQKGICGLVRFIRLLI